MTYWAVVPVKPLRRGKSRLAGVLTEDEREALNRWMLEHILVTIKENQQIGQTLVISRDTAALSLARSVGAKTLHEDGSSHLNLALERATAVVNSFKATGMLILPADLPKITSGDIQHLIDHAVETPSVAIAPDHRKEGTNALFIKPPGLVKYSFGEGSFERHVEQLEADGIPYHTCEIASLAHDVDLPEDLEFLDESPELWATT